MTESTSIERYGCKWQNDPRQIAVKMKLSALWSSTTLCYLYCDFLGMFTTGQVMDMNAGIMGPLGKVTDETMVGVSAMMAVPCVMVALSLLLPRGVARWSNIILGGAFTAIAATSMIGSPPFYIFFSVIEIALTLAIVWVALTWPRETSPSIFH